MSGRITSFPIWSSNARRTAGLRKVPPWTTIPSPSVAGSFSFRTLIEGIPDHRTGKTGRDLPHRGPLAEGLLHPGIHENGAARPEIEGLVRFAGHSGEVGKTEIEGAGKGFDEGAAARGAGLVDLDIGNAAVADIDRLHVLAADVEDERDVRGEEAGRAIVGHRLDDTVIQRRMPPG